jgi:hypothetical protein
MAELLAIIGMAFVGLYVGIAHVAAFERWRWWSLVGSGFAFLWWWMQSDTDDRWIGVWPLGFLAGMYLWQFTGKSRRTAAEVDSPQA